MGRYSLSDIVTLKRAEEQVADVLKEKWCKCGKPIKRGWEMDLCPRCRMYARRATRRAHGSKN